MGRRAERQKVHQHRLVVAPPVERDEAALGRPAHRDSGGARHGPLPVGPPVERIGVGPDGRLLPVAPVEVLLDEQHAGEEQGGVHRRQLDVLEAEAADRIEEMVEEAAKTAGTRRGGPLRQLVKEPEGREDPLRRGLPGDVAAFRADRVRGERKAHGRNAGERRGGPAVRGEAGALAGPFPEEVEGAAGDGVEQRLDAGGAGPRDRCRTVRAAAEESREKQGGGRGETGSGDRHSLRAPAVGLPRGHHFGAPGPQEARRCTRRPAAPAGHRSRRSPACRSSHRYGCRCCNSRNYSD
jgi:hypothetical protein